MKARRADLEEELADALADGLLYPGRDIRRRELAAMRKGFASWWNVFSWNRPEEAARLVAEHGAPWDASGPGAPSGGKR